MRTTTWLVSFEARKQYSRVYPILFANYNTSERCRSPICSRSPNRHCCVRDTAREGPRRPGGLRCRTAGGTERAVGARDPGPAGRTRPRAGGAGRRRRRGGREGGLGHGSAPVTRTACRPAAPGTIGAAERRHHPRGPREGAARRGRVGPASPGATGEEGGPGRRTHTRGSCSGGAPRLWNTPSTKTPFLPRQRR